MIELKPRVKITRKLHAFIFVLVALYLLNYISSMALNPDLIKYFNTKNPKGKK